MAANNPAQPQSPLEDAVHKALGLWHKSVAQGSPLSNLLVVQQALPAGGNNLRLATNQVLNQALAALAAHHPDEAELLRARFLDGKTVHLLSNTRNMAEATIYFQQHRAIALLAAIVEDMEAAARIKRRAALERRLPLPSYSALVGVQGQLEHLFKVISTPSAAKLFLLEGIGGIGKTSLAYALMSQVVERSVFADVGWISAQRQVFHLSGSLRRLARQDLTPDTLLDELAEQLLDAASRIDQEQALTALQERFALIPHLVVIDNLEMVADVERLFPMLRRLAGVSRFLLLSRQSFLGESDVFHFRLPELSQADALCLVRQEAELRNLPDLVDASDDSLQPIFATAGGNPLALRLIVGLVHIHPLPVILADLAAARGRSIESLYAYIYRRAWDALDELCRRALLAMPLAPESGGTLDYLAEVSALGHDDLRHALATLVDLNLLDSRGDLLQRRYAIHNLTRTFLLEQVIRWQA